MNKFEFDIVTGLGIGEEQKGASVEWLTWKMAAHTILRSGGCQSGHHITTVDGREHVFVHFGAGTFEGARTHLKHMVIDPIELFREAMELEEKGVGDALERITVSGDCLTVTPFHGAMSRLREILRGGAKKGTMGKGVGEAIVDSRREPKSAIYARDFSLSQEELEDKLEKVRVYKLDQAQKLVDSSDRRLAAMATGELGHLKDKTISAATAESYRLLADLVRIVDDKFLDSILAQPGTAINEADHGVLHHPRRGFLPHVTGVDPTSSNVLQTLKERKYKGEIRRFGVMRCYITRLGAGPLVSYDPTMTAEISDKNNVGNEWLGPFRVGAFDSVAFNYALEICGGRNAFRGLMVSHLDHLNKRRSWPVCDGYEFAGKASDLEDYFDVRHGVIVGIKFCRDSSSLGMEKHQLRLTELLKSCRPIVIHLRPSNAVSLERVFLNHVERQLQVPVVTVSYGPTKMDRKIRSGWENIFST